MLHTKIPCDASKTALGVILEQQHVDQWLPVAYAFRAITEIQGKYAPIEREALTIQFTCERFHMYKIWKISATKNRPQTTCSHIKKKKTLKGYKRFDSRCKNMICMSATFQETMPLTDALSRATMTEKNGKD